MFRVCLLFLFACTSGSDDEKKDTANQGPGFTLIDTGTRIAQEIEVWPLNVDFGDVPKTCSEERTFEVRNIGNYPLEVIDFELNGDADRAFEVTGETTILGPDSTMEVTVVFTPAIEGVYSGAYVRVLSNDEDDWKVDVTVGGTALGDEAVFETFVQGAGMDVDLLLVLDDAEDLRDRLASFADEAGTLLDSLDAMGVDYHVAVIDGDVVDPTHQGRFLGPVITPSTPDGDVTLGAQIRGATGGNASHMFFDVVEASLTEPLIAEENTSFLRPSTHLAVMVYTKNDDDSVQNGVTFAEWLESTRDPEFVSFSAVSGPKNGLLPCNPFGAAVEPASRIGTATRETGGHHMLICDYAANQIAGEMAAFAAGLQDTFALQRQVTVDDWMYVNVDGVEVVRSTSDGWSYDATTNAVTFNGTTIPRPGQSIEIGYPAGVGCD